MTIWIGPLLTTTVPIVVALNLGTSSPFIVVEALDVEGNKWFVSIILNSQNVYNIFSHQKLQKTENIWIFSFTYLFLKYDFSTCTSLNRTDHWKLNQLQKT